MAKKKRKAFGMKNLAFTGAVIQKFIDKRINDKLKDGLPTEFPTAEELTAMKTKLDAYPTITAAMKTDGKTWGIKNGGWDDVCIDGCEVLMSDKATAQSLALDSLQQGSLMPLVKIDADDKMYEEVRSLLGDEIFNELDANTKTTLEEAETLEPEQKLAMAKAEFFKRKNSMALHTELNSRLQELEDSEELSPIVVNKAYELAKGLLESGESVETDRIAEIVSNAIDEAKVAYAEQKALEAQRKALEAEEVKATDVETGEKDVEPKNTEKL